MISEQIVQELAEQLFTCFESGSAIAPITEAYPTLTIEEAYAIQRVLLTHHLAKGRRVVGRKIGATSKEVQRWVGVDQPDYGVLFDAFTFEERHESKLYARQFLSRSAFTHITTWASRS